MCVVGGRKGVCRGGMRGGCVWWEEVGTGRVCVGRCTFVNYISKIS